jgi:hypothetical protein
MPWTRVGRIDKGAEEGADSNWGVGEVVSATVEDVGEFDVLGNVRLDGSDHES